MRKVVVVRPEPGASETLAKARELSLEPVSVPLFEIQAMDWTMPDGAFDGVLLTSANAVRHAGDALQELRALPAYSVGDATAEAARDAGFDIKATGDAGVERLLGSIDQELRLIHLCGEDRKQVTARQEITPVAVYRSKAVVGPKLDRLNGNVVLVHSPRAGARLGELVEDKSDIAIVAISKAAADAAGGGWGSVQAADEPTDDAVLALAAELCNKPHP